MSLDYGMDKEHVVNLHNGVLLSGEKNHEICKQMDISRENHPQKDNPDPEKYSRKSLKSRY